MIVQVLLVVLDVTKVTGFASISHDQMFNKDSPASL